MKQNKNKINLKMNKFRETIFKLYKWVNNSRLKNVTNINNLMIYKIHVIKYCPVQ